MSLDLGLDLGIQFDSETEWLTSRCYRDSYPKLISKLNTQTQTHQTQIVWVWCMSNHKASLLLAVDEKNR